MKNNQVIFKADIWLKSVETLCSSGIYIIEVASVFWKYKTKRYLLCILRPQSLLLCFSPSFICFSPPPSFSHPLFFHSISSCSTFLFLYTLFSFFLLYFSFLLCKRGRLGSARVNISIFQQVLIVPYCARQGIGCGGYKDG